MKRTDLIDTGRGFDITNTGERSWTKHYKSGTINTICNDDKNQGGEQ